MLATWLVLTHIKYHLPMVSANHTSSNLAQVAKMTGNMTCDQVNTSKEKMDNDRSQSISPTAVLLMTTVTSSFPVDDHFLSSRYLCVHRNGRTKEKSRLPSLLELKAPHCRIPVAQIRFSRFLTYKLSK